MRARGGIQSICIQQKVKHDLPAAVQNQNVKELLQSRTLILQRVPEPRKLQVHKLDRTDFNSRGS